MTIPISHRLYEQLGKRLTRQWPEEFWSTLLNRLYDGVYVVDSEGRIRLWNKGAEDLSGYGKEYMVGKTEQAGLHMHIVHEPYQTEREETESIVRQTLADGVAREQECAFLHSDGLWVRVRGRSMAYRDRDGAVAGAAMVFSDTLCTTPVRQRLKELRHLALSDPLTGLGNRRYGEMSLRVRIDEMKRYGWPFGVLFMDLDGFKRVNDVFGHDVGDRALRMVADTLSHNVRPFDVVCRWGGEEFMAIITNINHSQLLGLAEKLRSLTERCGLQVGLRRVGVTVSVGATVAREKDTAQSLIERADRLMYKSKRTGKNRVCAEA